MKERGVESLLYFVLGLLSLASLYFFLRCRTMAGAVRQTNRALKEISGELEAKDVYKRQVTILPDEKIGIVVKPADKNGNVLVQLRNEKMLISHKRLRLKVAAAELYPEDYDFSILFDTVEVRNCLL